MLNYTNITQNTYIQSWTFTEIMTIEMCGLLECLRTVASVTLYMSTVPARQRDMAMQWPWRVHYSELVNCEAQTCLLFFPTWNIAICILCTDFVMAMQMLLSKNIEDVTPKWEFRLAAYLRVHQTLRDNGCLPSVAVQSEREMVQTLNTRENILEMVQRSPHLSTRRMASHIGVSHMQVWRSVAWFL